jgi:quinone-modifying oxidoreductase subunit QmoC
MAGARLVDPDLEFIRAVKSAGGETLKKCYQCATCSTVCNLSPDEKPFPRKEMLMANWGQTEDLMRDPDVWLCYQCNDCTTYCPRGARPGDVLAAIRAFTYRHFSFPSFMGKALSNPGALPLLIIIPILIMTACILLTAEKVDGQYLFMTADEIDFNYFLPHSTVDALFVLGNIVIFIFAAVGFVRFWKMLQSNGDRKLVSFGSALLSTFKEIFAHSRFRKCGANHARSTGHMMLLFGFIGAMITTAIVLLFVFIPHYLELLGAESIHSFFQVPIDLPHPVKILGALSGLALTGGGALLIYRRWTNKDEVGANGYADYLFLYVIFITGLSGMFSWLARLSGVALLAYAIYFVHILGVYFLLWYMPYSKFAHMFYRSLALVHAHTTGRIKG